MRRRKQIPSLGWAAAGGALAWILWRESRKISLEDKVAIVTGGSRGLGLVIARDLARRGARVAICARDRAELDRARQDLLAISSTVHSVLCDVSVKMEVADMVREVEERWGPIDLLINNAGVIQDGPVEEMTLLDYEEAMRIHFWGPLYAINAVLPSMKRRRAGRIVNIASIGGKVSVPHLVPYCASKFALVGLSEGLCAELAKDGIRVTTVCPGLMRTGSPVHAFFKGQHRREYALFSLLDSLPGLTISVERAAHRIIEAARAGRSELILTLPAKIGARLYALLPGTSSWLLGVLTRLLPGPGGIGQRRATGRESRHPLSPSLATALSDQAARRNNELG